MEIATPPVYAGLWSRTAAFAFDYVLIAAYIAVLVAVGALVRGIAPGLMAALFGNPATGELTGFVTLTLPVLLYFALSEATQAGATWGKRRLRLRVVDARLRRLWLPRSLLRTVAKFAPWELSHAVIWQLASQAPERQSILVVGLIVVWLLVCGNVVSLIFDRENRALYDRIANSRVIRLATAGAIRVPAQ
jgi:uncharacterized RDD family membrane protein YckC